MTTYKLKPKSLEEISYRKIYNKWYIDARKGKPIKGFGKKQAAQYAGIGFDLERKEHGQTLGSPQSESYNYDEAFQVYNSEEEGFNSPKEAVKWCNKMYQLTNDNRYKQISNYLHIYL